MSYLDKLRKKAQAEKIVKQILSSKEYQEAKKVDQEQWSFRAMAEFAFIGCVYLEMNFRCKQKGLEKWIDFVRDTVVEIGKDENYLVDSEKYYKEKYKLDVMERLGLRIERNEND